LGRFAKAPALLTRGLPALKGLAALHPPLLLDQAQELESSAVNPFNAKVALASILSQHRGRLSPERRFTTPGS
jgi:hypothetical protein